MTRAALILLLAAAPAPLGLVTPIGWAGLVVGAGLLLAGWSVTYARGGALLAALPPGLLGPAALYAAVLAWAGAQTWAALWPAAGLWAAAGGAVDGSVAAYGTLAPDRTATGILRLAAYAVLFVVALQLGRDRRVARGLLAAVAGVAGLYAVYGLTASFTDLETLLGIPDESTPVSGPLVNRNNFATYAGLGLLAATAMLYDGFLRAAGGVEIPRERLRLKVEYALHRAWPFAAAWIALVSALLLSASRGGFTASMLGLMAFFLALAFTRERTPRGVRVAATVALVALVVFAVQSGGRLIDRLAQVQAQAGSRLDAYATGLRAIAERPLTGHGLGAFEPAFRIYQPADLGGRWRMLHNTYLENALELGIPAAAALVAAVAWLGVRCARGAASRRRDHALPAVGVGATVLVGAHALVDFSLQIPAVTATYAVLLGLAVAQSWRSRSSGANVPPDA